MTDDDRLTDLEVSHMHLQRTLQELNDVVYRQQQVIDNLGREMKLLKEQLVSQSLQVAEGDEPPPPHY